MKRYFIILLSVLAVSCQIESGDSTNRNRENIERYSINLFEQKVSATMDMLEVSLTIDSYITTGGENPDGGELYEYVRNHLRHIDDSKLSLSGYGTVETNEKSLNEVGTTWIIQYTSSKYDYYSENGSCKFEVTCQGDSEWSIKQVSKPGSMSFDVTIGEFEGMTRAASLTVEGQSDADGGLRSTFRSGEEGMIYGYGELNVNNPNELGRGRMIFGEFYVETFHNDKSLDWCVLTFDGDSIVSDVSEID